MENISYCPEASLESAEKMPADYEAKLARYQERVLKASPCASQNDSNVGDLSQPPLSSSREWAIL